MDQIHQDYETVEVVDHHQEDRGTVHQLEVVAAVAAVLRIAIAWDHVAVALAVAAAARVAFGEGTAHLVLVASVDILEAIVVVAVVEVVDLVDRVVVDRHHRNVVVGDAARQQEEVDRTVEVVVVVVGTEEDTLAAFVYRVVHLGIPVEVVDPDPSRGWHPKANTVVDRWGHCSRTLFRLSTWPAPRGLRWLMKKRKR